MALVTRVMVRASRLPRTVRSRTLMAGSPRLAAIRKIACSEDAQSSCPVSRARRAAAQRIVASGWPVLMLAAVLMMRRKASRCRKFWWLMISSTAAVSARMPSAASRSWPASSGTGIVAAFMVMPPGRKKWVAAGRARISAVEGRLFSGHEGQQAERVPGRLADRIKAGIRCGRRSQGQAAPGKLPGSGAVAELAVDLAGDVPLQAADDFFLGESFLAAAVGVGAGGRVRVHPDDHDPPQRAVGPAVAAAVEPVPAGGLAGRSGDRGDAAQVRP